MGHPVNVRELVLDCKNEKYAVNTLTDGVIFGPVQYGWDRFMKDDQSMTFGGGLLAGSTLPGTRRMIFCGYSPQWEGFYGSALGGAMYTFRRTHLNFAWIQGQCSETSVIVIHHVNGEYSVKFDKIDPQKYWPGYVSTSGKASEGFYAIQQFLFDQYQPVFGNDNFRILTVGPASLQTNMGAIGSNHIARGTLTNIDDWAGRGGLGSRLLQYHHIAGIVYGGDWEDPELDNSKELDDYFLQHFGKRAIPTDLAFSAKYRYVPEFETGGTFGVNMYQGEDHLFSFNYTSVYQPATKRLEQNHNFIQSHYLKQFNEEIIQKKGFNHCGEPCAIVCKKVNDDFKKDYEPYEAFGPNCGIFDQRAAELINKYVDSMGIDAIQAGGLVDWLMELIWTDKINPADFGLPLDKPKFTFASSDAEFDIVNDSMHNAEYARAILKMILFDEKGSIFRSSIRQAARELDRKYGIHSIDSAVYTAHGESGCMVPNQYWVPGMFAPMPLMGKYFSYYGFDFMPPFDLGKKNVERFVYELYSENSGSCRFHRKWIEDIIDDIILSHFELNFDYWKTNFDLARQIHDFQSRQSVFWESERIIDIISSYLRSWKEEGLNNPDLDEWILKFDADKVSAAHEFWQAMFDGMSYAFEHPFDEPINKK
jgi:glyceraldehyde-3-phosphate dehydrogenase (ferredoxin)